MLPPTPTIAPKAAEIFITGNVRANPIIAPGPTPCPIKTPSIMLYNDEATIATIAGTAYCISRLSTGFSPSSLSFLSSTIFINL